MENRCNACGNPVKKTSDNDFDKLYLRILEIGQSKVDTGITYNQLVQELEKNYDIKSGCTELAIKHWFYCAFFHKAAEECPIEKLSDLETHLNCDFILKGETSLQLLEHQNIKKTVRLALIAIYVALAVGIVSILSNCHSTTNDEKKDEKQIQVVEQPKMSTPILVR